MGEELRHNCGLIAFSYREPSEEDKLNILRKGYSMTVDSSNRGQLSCGFSVYNPESGKRIKTRIEPGGADELYYTRDTVESKKLMFTHKGVSLIGHVRYATSGEGDSDLERQLYGISFEELTRDLRAEGQPAHRDHVNPYKNVSFAWNGTLTNYEQIRAEMKAKGYPLPTRVDTELIKYLLSKSLHDSGGRNSAGENIRPDLFQVASLVMGQLEGGYSIATLFGDGRIMLIRGPEGIRPLHYALEDKFFAASSESFPLDRLGAKNVISLEPGACVVFDGNNLEKRILASAQVSHCFFEWLYFSFIASSLEGKSVYSVRKKMGRILAEDMLRRGFGPHDRPNSRLVPVPNSGKYFPDEMAAILGIKKVDALIKVKGDRTFINGPDTRNELRAHAYAGIREELEGMDVYLTEDSIIRGETLIKLVGFVKGEMRARSVHVISACPPVFSPCFYGIDMSTCGELIANRVCNGEDPSKFDIPEFELRVARATGADSVHYANFDMVRESIGLDGKLCGACVTGIYPTVGGTNLAAVAWKDWQKSIVK